MPLFRRKDEPPLFSPPVFSIRDVPNWEEALRVISDGIGVEYEVVTKPAVADVYGTSRVEAARDNVGVTMLVPSSFNVRADLRNFVSVPLIALDLGLSNSVKGGSIVGQGKTFANRQIVDSFVRSMSSVYGISWESILATVHRSRLFPMLLVSDQFTLIVAPVIPPKDTTWPNEKYHPLI